MAETRQNPSPSRSSRTSLSEETKVQSSEQVNLPVPDNSKAELGIDPKLEKEAVDENLVTWDGEYDRENPKNWSGNRKWAALFIVSCFAFISPVSSSMIAPSLQDISSELKITSSVESQLTLSVFILAYAVGPMFLGPLSETYGRVPVLQLANLFYLAFNIACGFARTKSEMIAFRFLSGLGGSAPMAVAGGVVTDLFELHERGKAVSIYTLAPLLGPAVGPIMGGFITENTTWRWVFWATSIGDGVIQIAGLIFLQETYAPVLLAKKCKSLRQSTQNAKLYTAFDGMMNLGFGRKLYGHLTRPFRMLATQPIIQFQAVYMAYLYGLMYIVLSTFTTLFSQVYSQGIGIGSLNYISLGLGFFLAAQIAPRVGDRIYRNLTAKNGGVKKAEFRTPPIVVGSILVPIGLFIYGWTAEYHTHWIAPDIGTFIFAMGVIACFQSTQIYLVDAYTQYAASALGAVNFLRSIAGFGFPLFAPKLYEVLGYGWGNSLLGFAAIVLGCPAPWILWKYGERLRAMSPFAAG